MVVGLPECLSAASPKKTTVSQAWIAEHLGMRNAANVSGVIRRMDLSQLQGKASNNLRRFVSEK
jgi:hypothetical protein